MVLSGHISKVEEREASERFPRSWSLTVLDTDKGETLKLSASEEVAKALEGSGQFAPVVLRVDWFAVQSERGTTYRLRAVGVEKSPPVAAKQGAGPGAA